MEEEWIEIHGGATVLKKGDLLRLTNTDSYVYKILGTTNNRGNIKRIRGPPEEISNVDLNLFSYYIPYKISWKERMKDEI